MAKEVNVYAEALAKARLEEDELATRLATVQSVIDQMEKLVGAEQPQVRKRVGAPAPRRRGAAKMSASKAAEIVLRERGEPMHLKKIVDAVLAGGYSKATDPKKLYVNLYGSMSREGNKVFRKEAEKATFGLIEWAEAEPSVAEEVKTSEEGKQE